MKSSNLLVRAMTLEDRALLAPRMVRVDLPLRHRLARPDAPTVHVVFIDEGIGSVVAVGGDKEVEAGIFGRESVSATSVALGVDRSPHDCFIQIAGHGWRLTACEFAAAMDASATLHALVLRYVQTAMVQAAYTIKAAAISRLDQRLARWLLMCHDRVDGNDLALTHQFMAMMLGTRRAGVTDAIHVLEGERLIAAERGRIVVRDRAGLEALAGSSYGTPEAEYERLVGQRLSRSPRLRDADSLGA